MDPASFFLLLIVLVIGTGGAIAYFVMRGVVRANEGGDRRWTEPRPRHSEVSSVYHDHTDLLAGSPREPERGSSDREHQSHEG